MEGGKWVHTFLWGAKCYILPQKTGEGRQKINIKPLQKHRIILIMDKYERIIDYYSNFNNQ